MQATSQPVQVLQLGPSLEKKFKCRCFAEEEFKLLRVIDAPRSFHYTTRLPGSGYFFQVYVAKTCPMLNLGCVDDQ